ncbi:MAG: ActS/PrrB/RegB family redox-sensitive histidine kinase [Alphaproteobacteria bacterium]|nr:ActS/PrrB/RegB family redox-sensitive histidine kinase [Alphaproteobacteria bacterium]
MALQLTDLSTRTFSTRSVWRRPGRVRLETLILIRWLAIIGQSAAVLFVEFGLGLSMPLGPALAVIAMSAWVNLFLMIARPTQGPVKEWEAAVQLAYDILQLALLLGLTGGVQNPFVVLFIAPVAISAAVLRPAITALLASLAIVSVAGLRVWRAPLPWFDGAGFDAPPLYEAGLAAAAITGLVFTGIYAWAVAAEEERMTLALAATEAVLAREQRLSALGGLAAAAAHALGTPLATIHLAAKEMARTLPADSPLSEDVHLLVSQAERCRGILQQLSIKPEEGDAVHARAPLGVFLDEAAGPHRGQGVSIALRLEGPEGARPPDLRRMPEILHGLGNLIENAVSFAREDVEIAARWTDDAVTIAVRDDGPGFSGDVIARLGAPYLSVRRGVQRGKAGGLGLGFFIAKTLLEGSGGKVTARNRTGARGGAVVSVTWPRNAIEAAPL